MATMQKPRPHCVPIRRPVIVRATTTEPGVPAECIETVDVSMASVRVSVERLEEIGTTEAPAFYLGLSTGTDGEREHTAELSPISLSDLLSLHRALGYALGDLRRRGLLSAPPFVD